MRFNLLAEGHVTIWKDVTFLTHSRKVSFCVQSIVLTMKTTRKSLSVGSFSFYTSTKDTTIVHLQQLIIFLANCVLLRAERRSRNAISYGTEIQWWIIGLVHGKFGSSLEVIFGYMVDGIMHKVVHVMFLNLSVQQVRLV